MTGTGEREFLVAEAVARRRAAFHQRQCLQRLDRRARIYLPRNVAQRQHSRAVGIRDRDRAAVVAFGQRTAHDLHNNRITHLSCFPNT